jgi:hypothetical protein
MGNAILKMDNTIPKIVTSSIENSITEPQNQNNVDLDKERKEKRTKKEKKENINININSKSKYIIKEKEKEIYKEKEKESLTLPSWLPIEIWNAFVDMRKKIKHPLTDYAVRLYYKAFERARQGGISEAEIIEAIETSIAKGWQGIFVQGTDILKFKPEPNLLPIQAKKVRKFDGMTDEEYYAMWKQVDEIKKKEVETTETEIKGNENIKPVGVLVQSFIDNLETKQPNRDERLKMGWGVKTFTSGFV